MAATELSFEPVDHEREAEKLLRAAAGIAKTGIVGEGFDEHGIADVDARVCALGVIAQAHATIALTQQVRRSELAIAKALYGSGE